MGLFFSSFSGCWVFNNFSLKKFQNIYGINAASGQQKLAADIPSFSLMQLFKQTL
jgi:hypothetical protein